LLFSAVQLRMMLAVGVASLMVVMLSRGVSLLVVGVAYIARVLPKGFRLLPEEIVARNASRWGALADLVTGPVTRNDPGVADP
jgi:hypothetical protein